MLLVVMIVLLLKVIVLLVVLDVLFVMMIALLVGMVVVFVMMVVMVMAIQNEVEKGVDGVSLVGRSVRLMTA